MRAPEDKESKVPAGWRPKVIAHVMDAKQLVIYESLDEVEGSPPDEQHPEMGPPGRRELATLPGAHGEHHRRRDEEPGRQVEHPVGK